MTKVLVLYYSSHGHIETMAGAIAEGVGEAVPDLDYAEDSNAEADANFVMTGKGAIVEIQGTAEAHPFSQDSFDQFLLLAKKGIGELINLQALTVA